MGAVIAFVNQKGGCAKSTTAVHFAQWLIRQKRQAILVDADAQGSSSIWLSSLEAEIPCEVAQTSKALLDCLPKLINQYEQVVVDGPAGLSEATQSILAKADLAIIPCQPSGVDLRSAKDAIQLIKEAQAQRQGAPKAAVFLSRAVRGTRLKDEALQSLSNIGIPLLKTAIHQRQAVADTFGQEATVWDLLGAAAAEAAAEFEELFKEIMRMAKQ
jgi:chromosome partitioning protein